MPRTASAEQTHTSRENAKSSVGVRIRAARAKAGLTQQQVAGDRYTKAYISALENGLVRPSVVALEYIAERLGTTSSALLTDGQKAWSRLDADLRLASGDWRAAADAYRALIDALPKGADPIERAELHRGEAEALVRLELGAEATASASKAVETFEKAKRETDAALASYWLSAALYVQGNIVESKAILHAVLGKVRAGLEVEPDFKLRLVMALSAAESLEGNHETALSYLEEVRSLAETLDDRRRAVYLFGLAYSYTETGDYEAAIRAGHASLALFAAADASMEVARIENELAIAHMHTGNLARAREFAQSSDKRFVELHNDRQRAHVLDTLGMIELAAGDPESASQHAQAALELSETVDNPLAGIGALTTLAKASAHRAASGDAAAADSAREYFERAAELCRTSNKPALLRSVLTEYADFVATQGDHKRAFDLTREALAAQR